MSTGHGPNPTSQGVRGYRDLAASEVDMINHIKELEEQVAGVWGAVERQPQTSTRWLDIARTRFQEGFSALVRSIAQPDDPFARYFADNQQDEAEQSIPQKADRARR